MSNPVIVDCSKFPECSKILALLDKDMALDVQFQNAVIQTCNECSEQEPCKETTGVLFNER